MASACPAHPPPRQVASVVASASEGETLSAWPAAEDEEGHRKRHGDRRATARGSSGASAAAGQGRANAVR